MSRKGFTLIELIIVVIIIGILAAIAAPMMSSNVKAARQSEAIAGLGAIRTAERLYYVTNNSYIAATGAQIAAASTALNQYLGGGDLNGTSFYSANYVINATTTAFNATATGNTAAGSLVNGIVVNMDQNGVLNNN